MLKEEIVKLFEPIDVKKSTMNSNGLISFSLYGPHDIYNIGALENVSQAREYFHQWNLRFYVAEDCPILPRLWEENVDIFVMKKPQGTIGMFWRFQPISEENYDYVLIRDVDQRLSEKDLNAVNVWIERGQLAHRMHEDNSQTSIALMGCAIGFKTMILPDVLDDMVSWIQGKENCEITHTTKERQATGFPRLLYGADQVYLEERIWPVVQHDCLTHGVMGEDFPQWQSPLKWGGHMMFRRIVPNTSNTEVFGARPQYAYDTEAH